MTDEIRQVDPTTGEVTERPAPMTPQEQRIQRAYERARDHVRRGVVPTLIETTLETDCLRERWVMPSATRDNLSWVVELTRNADGIATACKCEAAQKQFICWHRALTRLAHLDVVPVKIATPVRYRVKEGFGPKVW
jgi:hypothetical protein